MHVGYLIGSWLLQSYPDILQPVNQSTEPYFGHVATSCLRMFIGLPLVFMVRFAIRTVVLNIVYLICMENKRSPESIKKPNVELLHKYFSYLLLGLTGVLMIPLFEYTGLVY